MNTKTILTSEVESLKIATLPRRPTAPKAHGGAGLSAQEMKAAFDKLPLLLVARLNSLISDIESEGDGKIGESIKTGLFSYHTLNDFFSDVKSGNMASYLVIGDTTLAEKIAHLDEKIEELKKAFATEISALKTELEEQINVLDENVNEQIDAINDRLDAE